MCEKNLSALASHWIKEGMDDRDHIRIVRVLIDATESLLDEAEQSDTAIEKTLFMLQEHARDLYVKQCVATAGAMANQGEYADECREVFDYLFAHGEYPDA